jgi:uncharacterized protein (TIGR02001 family)
MKMKQISTLCLAGSMLAAAPLAMAWESENGEHSVEIGVSVATDYIWRGYSQTNRDPAASGSIDYAHSSGLYVGTWASNVDFADDADVEVDIYAGFSNEIGDTGIGYDVGVLRYLYDDESYDWNEYYASLSYSYFSFGVAHSDNTYDSDEDGTYYSLGFDTDLPWYDLALSAGIGYYDYDSGVVNVKSAEHTDWRIGLSKSISIFDLGVTYTGMDSDAEDDIGRNADDRLVFSVSTTLF